VQAQAGWSTQRGAPISKVPTILTCLSRRSATLFAIRRVPRQANATLTLDTVFIDGADLSVTRSQQRYDRLGPKRFRYVDLGVARGFEANLLVGEHGLVLRYEHLFERISSD